MRPLFPILAALLLLAGATSVTIAASDAPEAPRDASVWPAPVGAASDHEPVGNGAISFRATAAHLRDVRFPVNGSNTFLETTGGGESYALRYGSNLAGPYWGGFGGSSFVRLDNRSYVSQDHSSDGAVSVVVLAEAVPSGDAAIALSYWVRNNGGTTLPLKIYEYVEPNANSEDEETTTRGANGVFASTNAQGAQATLGLVACGPSRGHSVGPASILDGIRADSLNGATNYTGDSWYVETQGVDALAPGNYTQFSFVLRATSGSVDDAAAFCPAAGAPPVSFPVPPPPPAPPTNLTATAEPGVVRLAWEHASTARPAYYEVFRGEGACDAAVFLGYTAGTPAFDDFEVDGGSVYCYYVRSWDNGTVSAPSNEAFAEAIAGTRLEVTDLWAWPGFGTSDGSVSWTVANVGRHDAARGLLVHTSACPATAGACRELGVLSLDGLSQGESVSAAYAWDAFGSVGDFDVCVRVYHGAAFGPPADTRCERVQVGPVGAGVGAQAPFT